MSRKNTTTTEYGLQFARVGGRIAITGAFDAALSYAQHHYAMHPRLDSECPFRRYRSGVPHERDAFYGGPYAEALTRTAWPEGLELLAKMPLVAPDVPVSIRRKPRYGPDGDELCSDRLYDGRLGAAWSSLHRATRAGSPIVTLAIDLFAGATQPASELIYRGIAAVRAVDALETAGYRVELYVCKHTNLDPCEVPTTVVLRVKAANESLNVDRVLFACAHPSSLRFVIFSLLTSVFTPVDSISERIGIPDECTIDMVATASSVRPDYVVPGSTLAVHDAVIETQNIATRITGVTRNAR